MLNGLQTQLSRWRSFGRRFRGKGRPECDLNAELQAYIDHAVDQKIAEGMTPEEARRAAAIEFGGVEQVKESVRDIQVGAWMAGLAQDLRYAVRVLAKQRALTAMAVLTMGLGIAAATSTFSIVD